MHDDAWLSGEFAYNASARLTWNLLNLQEAKRREISVAREQLCLASESSQIKKSWSELRVVKVGQIIFIINYLDRTLLRL